MSSSVVFCNEPSSFRTSVKFHSLCLLLFTHTFSFL
nr:MAG TPA: hypothetical protein [Bacteriophage sp.]